MNRLYDRLMQHTQFESHLKWDRENTGECIIIDATEPTLHLFTELKKMPDISRTVPPFFDCFIEISCPLSHPGYLPEGWGWRIRVEKGTEDDLPVKWFSRWDLYIELKPNNKGVMAGFQRHKDSPHMRYAILGPEAYVYVKFDENGNHIYPSSFELVSGGMYDTLLSIRKDPSFDIRWVWESAISYMSDAAFFCLALLNAKNVELINHEPPSGLSRKQERRCGVPLVSYKTLKPNSVHSINPYFVDSEKSSISLSGQSHSREALWRGHFKDYRDGKGLFGKYKDVYWWDQHLRGSAENGIVIKDYEVEAPKEEK